MPWPRYWILQSAPHITETYIPEEGGDIWYYEVSPDNMVRRDDVLYFWLNYQRSFYGWGEVAETPQIIEVDGPQRNQNGESVKRRRQRIKVHRRKQFLPSITAEALSNDSNLKRILPGNLDDLFALSITKVQANYLNDFARENGHELPDGSAAVKITVEETMPEFILKAVVELGDKTVDGRLVEAVLLPWYEIIDRLIRNPDAAHEIPSRMWEEIVAGVYSAAGFDTVILTPRSGDYGRDVIAEKNGVGKIRVIDQVKAYGKGRLVEANDARAIAGVLAMEKASKAFLTTTSDFAPLIRQDPFIKSWIPNRLELIDGHQLIKRLIELRSKKPNSGLIIK